MALSTTASARGPFGGWTQLLTREGETIRVEVDRTRLAVIVEAPNGDTVAHASIPYPSAGYGGHELQLSAQERYLAMFLYSGQSEVGYELFDFRPSLRHIRRLPYVFGMGLGPAFSSDERLLGLAWATNSSLYIENHDLDDDGLTTSECVVEWAQLHLQELPEGRTDTCAVQIRVPPGFPFEGDDSFYPEHLEILSPHEVRFQTAWGGLVRVPSPLPESVLIAGPSVASSVAK